MSRMKPLSHYLHGEWVSSDDDGWTDDLNPSDAREVLAHIPHGSATIVERAVMSAAEAFPRWNAMSGPERAEALHRAANTLMGQRDAIALLVAKEVGKPVGEAFQEVDRGVAILRYFAEEAVHPIGQVIPAQRAGSLQFSFRQPLGVVAVISPWNFPIAIPLWKIAPALAFGNTVVWKPAEVASLTASALTHVFAESGLPNGVLNLTLGKGTITGDALVQHPDVQAVTFTGSDAVGMHIAEQCARRNRKYQIEMGGKNAAIVLADANLTQAAQLTASGAMRYAGQKCTATSRVIVAQEIFDRFLAQLSREIQALAVALATDPSSAIGPLISAEAREHVQHYAQLGAQTGTLVLGGHPLADARFAHGYFFEPTLITDISPDAPLVQEEIFGPLLVALPARTPQHAVELANQTKYGLSVALFTRDITAALNYMHTINCGMVRVNGDTTGVDPHAPFGGMRASSSHSREQGPAAIEFFTEIKTVQINAAG